VWVTISVILVVAIVAFWHGIRLVDPESVEKMIATNLPVGADKSEVLRFLEANRIIHSRYYTESNRIYAGINRSSIGMMPGRIHIEFHFSSDGKLMSFVVKEIRVFL
jgi:hypothetical protein